MHNGSHWFTSQCSVTVSSSGEWSSVCTLCFHCHCRTSRHHRYSIHHCTCGCRHRKSPQIGKRLERWWWWWWYARSFGWRSPLSISHALSWVTYWRRSLCNPLVFPPEQFLCDCDFACEESLSAFVGHCNLTTVLWDDPGGLDWEGIDGGDDHQREALTEIAKNRIDTFEDVQRG